MKTGIIGAGRVGCSLGKYFRSKNADLVGYYDTNAAAAKEAAAFTQTAGFDQVQQLVRESDILFITTPDSLLVPVWEEIKGMSHRNQIICHCSGALSSDSFSKDEHMTVSCCSIHPMLPFSNRFSSYEQLNNAFFTVEGDKKASDVLCELFRSFGNEVCIIDKSKKAKYHAAASILSNQVIAVLDMGYSLLTECGFTREEALRATSQLVTKNIENVIANDCSAALTGPIERGDAQTIKKHLDCLSRDDAKLYKMLAERLVRIAKNKNANKDYSDIENLLNEDELRGK